MRLCLINSSLHNEMRELGHEVLDVHPEPGVHDLSPLLAEHDFKPEVIIQQETLGPRVLLRGLEAFPGIKVYWSVDTHLNVFWQIEYVRLFDLVCSTQKHWAEHLQKQTGVPAVWLPWFGRCLPWRGWARRTRDICFVGRVTQHRPTRRRFIAFLHRRFNLELIQDIPFQEMLETYHQTRLAPNESIFGEVNFRLFEAASCGALVLNPWPIPGLEDLFDLEQEIGTYRHALELANRIDRFRADPRLAERTAKAAWARIQAEHLPLHRARTLVEAIAALTRSGRSPSSNTPDLPLTLYRLWLAQRSPVSTQELERLLLALPESPRKRCALLGLWTGLGKLDLVHHDVMALHQSDSLHNDPLLDRTASLAALHLDQPTLAKAFWLRHQVSSGRSSRPPKSPKDMYLDWAREFQRQDCLARPGLPFDHLRHLPDSALECLILAHRLDSSDMAVCRYMDALLDNQPGFESLRLSLLSHLTLHQPGNWLAGLKLGLVNLQGFRLKEGLEELLLAASRAEERGELRKFNNALTAVDSEGSIRAAMNPRDQVQCD